MNDMDVIHCKTSLGVDFKMAVDPQARDAVSCAVKSGALSLPPSIEVLLAGLERRGPVLDLGAHIGTFSIAAAALGYDVLAVEASPRNVELLKAGIRLNGFRNLRVVHAAITDRIGAVSFFENGPYGLVNTARFAPAASFEVPALTVDELLRRYPPAGRIGFIKMDIEGSEVAAVRGMPETLSGPDAPPVYYESNGHTLHLFDQTPQRLVGELRKHGYTSYLAESGRLRPLGDDDTQFSCVVDNLAAKKLIGRWPSWRTGRLTVEGQIRRALDECASPTAVQRAHVARAFEQASPILRNDPRIREALRSLKADADADVALAMRWFSAGDGTA